MMDTKSATYWHIDDNRWRETSRGEARGYVQPDRLEELWFHTGTVCNLRCQFCFEGSNPENERLQRLTLADVRPFVDEAMVLGVQRFSFTGGEPFVIPEMIDILDYALDRNPCLVLTNATRPLTNRLTALAALTHKPHRLSFRVSLDDPDPQAHDLNRGEGNFRRSLQSMKSLIDLGFRVSVAYQIRPGQCSEQVETAFRRIFRETRLPDDLRLVSFPDLDLPFASPAVPEITENCMTRYKTEAQRAAFMCNFSKMVVKIEGKMRVYACTLVDDDPDYDLGGSLTDAMKARVMLRHHRCFGCFSSGTTCSEARG